MLEKDITAELKLLLEKTKNEENENFIVTFEIPDTIKQLLEDQIDKEFDNYKFAIDAYSLKHIFKAHGNQLKEESRGQIAIKEENILLIPKVLASPDLCFYDGTNRVGREVFQFQKKIGDLYIVIKEVRSGKKLLALNSMRIIKKAD
ncbi:PBECR3 domain-containing polyvalent protein [Emticicia fontis]